MLKGLTRYMQAEAADHPGAVAYRRLRTSEITELFQRIERGLRVYESEGDVVDLTPSQRSAFVNLALAYETLYMTNQDLVISTAAEYRRQRREALRPCRAGLVRAIRTYSVSSGAQFPAYARACMQAAVHGLVPKQEPAAEHANS